MQAHRAAAILRDMNYRVFGAPAAASAAKIAEREKDKIDLLLTDVMLPDNNGRQLAEELQMQYPNIKVLFMTGYSRDAIAHPGQLDRGGALIQKPLAQASLAAQIREVLDNEKGPAGCRAAENRVYLAAGSGAIW